MRTVFQIRKFAEGISTGINFGVYGSKELAERAIDTLVNEGIIPKAEGDTLDVGECPVLENWEEVLAGIEENRVEAVLRKLHPRDREVLRKHGLRR